MRINVGADELRAIRKKMGIDKLVAYEPDTTWRINRDIDLETGGINITPVEINDESNGLLAHEGRRILVYIRDQYISYTANEGYKFHVADCSKIQEMKNNKRFDGRYVASARIDGKFPVNIIDFDRIIEENKLIEMRVCKLCLTEIDYKHYKTENNTNRKKIYHEFFLEEFFEICGGTKISRPTHNDLMPLSKYSLHQEVFSRVCRERARWKCEECGIYVGGQESQKFLHAHHVDGNKSNNRAANLRALCVDCHNKQAGHSLPENIRREFRDWKKKRGLG